MKEYLSRGLSPLLPLAWIFVGTNLIFPFMTRPLGLIMAIFYCIHAGYLSWKPGFLGFLESVCSALVGSLYLWFFQGLGLPPEAFFVVFPISFAVHMTLEKRRERLLAAARARASVHV